MKRLLLLTMMTAFALAGLVRPGLTHEGHGATIGEVVSVTADTMELKTAKGSVTIKLTDKTAYELNKKAAAKSDLKKGDRVAVTASKSMAGVLVATKVVLGLPVPGAKPKPAQ